MALRSMRVIWWLLGIGGGGGLLLGATEVWAANGQPGPSASYVLYETRFDGNAFPAGWVERGGWTVQDGLRSPPQGGYECYAVWQKETSLERTLLEATVRFDDPQTCLGLVRQDLTSPRRGFLVAGTMALLDGGAGRIRFCSAWDGTNQPLELASEPLPFVLQRDHDYQLCLWKTDIGHQAFAVLDPASGQRAVVTALRTYSQNPGRQTDAPGFLLVSGAAIVKRMSFSTVSSPTPRLVVFGDSCAEGDAIKPYFDDRYPTLVADLLQGDCAIAAHSGESTATVLPQLELDLDSFSPAFVLLPFARMDPDFLAWETGIRRLIARVEARGAIPILATSIPLVSREAHAAAITDWVRASGYPYVDFAQALGQPYDRTRWEPTLVHSDLIHPNRKGNRAIVDQFLKDVPQLFDAPAGACRRLCLPDSVLPAGAILQLPVELTALGNEWFVQFSIEFDPAALAFHSASPASTLPPGTIFRQLTDSARLGRVGFRLQCPPEQAISAGTQTVVTVTFQSVGPSPFTQTSVRLDDRPAITLIAPLARETHQNGTVTLRGQRSPIIQWSLDGSGREATDPSLDGKLLGPVPTLEPARGALAFDGTGARVAVPANPAPASLRQVTLSAWVKPSELAGMHYLLAGECANSSGLFLRLRDGALEAGTWRGGQEQTVSAVLGDGAVAWSHLAAVHNGWGWRLYRNGAELGRMAAPLPALDGNVEWTLGARRDGAGGLAGLLSDVRLYDRALEPAELASLSVGAEASHRSERTMLDDALPARSLTNEYGGEGWIWTASEPAPVSGLVAHRTPPHAGLAQHYFRRADHGWPVGPGEILYAHVYLDPGFPTRMIALQWLEEGTSWEHRAYWGDALWPYGEEAPVNRRCMGRLPPAGRWTRLEVPAAWVGLEGRSITGMSFVLYDGAAAWDLAGIASPALAEPAAALGGPVLLPGGQLQFSVPTHPALATHVFGSCDLDHWVRLTTLAFPFAGGVFVDDPATGPPVRFYRLVQEPR